MDRDEVVQLAIGNLQRYLEVARAPVETVDVIHPAGKPLGHEELRIIRAMSLVVYLSAMPGHTTLAGPDELLPLMRSDWDLLMQAWNEAGLDCPGPGFVS